MSKLYQRKSFYKIGVFLLLLLNNVIVFGDPQLPPQAPPDEESAFALTKLFSAIYQILLPASIILGVVLIIINGYGLLTSEGEPRKVQTSRENLTSAILGLVFVLAALAVYRIIVTSFFGGDFPNPPTNP